MDLLTCAGLSWALTLLQGQLCDVGGPGQPASWKAFAFGFIINYLSLKFYRTFLYPNYFSPLRHLPGPKDNHWLLGQLPNQFKADTPMSLPVKWAGAHPEAPLIRYLGLCNKEILIPNSTQVLRQILQTQSYSFEKPNNFKRLIRRFGGDGLATLENEEHRADRKILNACFTPSVLQKLNVIFSEKAAQLSLLLNRAIEAGGGGSCVVDCTDVFSRVTLDVIGGAVFGTELNYLKHAEFDHNGNPINRKGEYGFHEAHNVIFGTDNAFGTVLMLLDGYFPTRWIPCDINVEFNKAAAYIREKTGQLVAQRLMQFAVAEGVTDAKYKPGDTLSFLLDASMPGGSAEGMSEARMVGHLLNLLAGGHETSAHTLAWSTHILATRPDIQDRLREDISGLAARNPQPAFKDIDALPYLNNFVLESLRVYPAVVISAKEASKEINLEGITIPKGAVFEVIPAVTHMNPLIWGEDAASFDPGRWDTIGGPGNPRSSPFAFMPFGNGPRVCIGKKFALNEIKIVLFEMVRRFRFVDVRGEFPPFTVENPGIVLRPRGMKVRMEKIEGE